MAHSKAQIEQFDDETIFLAPRQKIFQIESGQDFRRIVLQHPIDVGLGSIVGRRTGRVDELSGAEKAGGHVEKILTTELTVVITIEHTKENYNRSATPDASAARLTFTLFELWTSARRTDTTDEFFEIDAS